MEVSSSTLLAHKVGKLIQKYSNWILLWHQWFMWWKHGVVIQSAVMTRGQNRSIFHIAMFLYTFLKPISGSWHFDHTCLTYSNMSRIHRHVIAFYSIAPFSSHIWYHHDEQTSNNVITLFSYRTKAMLYSLAAIMGKIIFTNWCHTISPVNNCLV